MDKRPIGVFDSGLGGVSTLIRARNALPTENFVYYGDNGNAPYGSRSKEDIQVLSLQACRFLLEHDAKALLVACNTATAAAYELLTQEMPVPVIGVEPAILEAVAVTERGLVLMLATEATVRLARYHRLRERLEAPSRVKDVPCPAELVRRVEAGTLASGSYDDLLQDALMEFEGEEVVGIVLGCTHYSFVQAEIARYAQAHFAGAPRFFEGGRTAVALLETLLLEKGICNLAGSGEVAFYTSGNPAIMRPRFEALLQRSFEF